MAKQDIKAIILASGTGSRINKDIPKQYLQISGSPLIIHTLRPFVTHKDINEIIIVSLPDYIDNTWKLVHHHRLTKVKKIVPGGKTRQESSRIGIGECGDDTNFVLIHDAVRPFVSAKLLNKMIRAFQSHDAVVPIIPTSDTIIEIDKKGFIKNIPDRENLMRVQTPQGFMYKLIKEAHVKALRDGIDNYTDDSSLVLRIGHPVFTFRGEDKNIKITLPIDIYVAGKLFQQ